MAIADGTYKVGYMKDGSLGLRSQLFMGKGYWVAEHGGVEVNGLDESALKDALYLLDVESDEHIGIWTDEETQLTYVGRSHYFVKEQTAKEIGRFWDQAFIWDCANGEELELV